ncbi:hypothetical protein AGMMS4957_08050 [Bacteroidia bacterium]|nr:hypothetical protein AGMMS4957_08050 [Bacteroidia bacterium]
MEKNMYDLDVATEIIARMKAEVEHAYAEEQDSRKKEELKLDLDVLWAEGKALYSSNELIQLSIIDKAFRLYAPILKAQYAAA